MICLLRVLTVCQNGCLFDVFSTALFRILRLHCHTLTGDRLVFQIVQGNEYNGIRILQFCLGRHDIDGGDTIDLTFIFHLGIHLRQTFNCFLILIIFIFQTAFQFSTHTGKLFRIQCEKLILCHIDGNDIKMGLESAAAAFHTTGTDPTEHLCLVSFADLT